MTGLPHLKGTELRRLSPGPNALDSAVAAARSALLARQNPDGHWCAELEGDTILESEWVLLMAFLGREADPRVRQAANYLLQKQGSDGGWANYPDGPGELSVTVKAYFALKIAGESSDAAHMVRARDLIRRMGGAESTNSFTRYYLALLGQAPYDNCPAVPPELILLPRWFPINVYAMSSWSRTIFVPLSVVWATKPRRQLPDQMSIDELFLEPPQTPRPACTPSPHRFSWTNFFLRVDRWLKRFERWGLMLFRKRAVRKCVAWVRERREDSDGVGAIFPPMIYNAILLRAIGVPDDDEEMVWALKQLDDLMIHENGTTRIQPCFSPVWDTTLSLAALADADQPSDSNEINSAVGWLLEKECRRAGDWAKTNPRLEPGGWFFEYRNGFYPDFDDTIMALMALARHGRASDPDVAPAVKRAINWLLGMQNSDGGWAAFDRDITKQFLEKVPFADHNAMLDPACPDITARILEGLADHGFQIGQKPIDQAIAFVLRNQESDGSWFGRWGVNYIYGTWQVLVGLKAIGVDMDCEAAQKAVSWLKSVQNDDGGWGETCASYDDPSLKGQGPSTASQTAWAIMGLLAGEGDSEAVRSGVDYLIHTQNAEGSWDEEPFTGTGFPKVFYLKYHLYALYFPLMALGRYSRSTHFEHLISQ